MEDIKYKLIPNDQNKKNRLRTIGIVYILLLIFPSIILACINLIIGTVGDKMNYDAIVSISNWLIIDGSAFIIALLIVIFLGSLTVCCKDLKSECWIPLLGGFGMFSLFSLYLIWPVFGFVAIGQTREIWKDMVAKIVMVFITAIYRVLMLPVHLYLINEVARCLN